MSRQINKLIVLSIVLSMALSVSIPAMALPAAAPRVEKTGAAPATAEQPAAAVSQTGKTTTVPEISPEAEGPIAAPQDEPKGPAHFVVELTDEPTAVTFAASLEAKALQATAAQTAQAQLARIESAQQALLAPLAKLGATVIYRTQRVYNGVAVYVDAAKVKEIEQLPGVRAVHPLLPKLIDNWHSVPLIGAPQLWDATGPFAGLDGTGIKVGVIDSGIDYLHTDFGGLGTTAVYSANDTTVITDTYNGNLLYPTVKVAGGWDFVGDAYNGDGTTITETVPHPDPDPAACLTGGSAADHGTHVAGTVAGYGVNADGTTYTGTYTAGMNFNGFKVGPGVAPKATLYSLRVFGCSGASYVVDQAIEWAVDPNGDGDFSDHLDVINMSLGDNYGAYDPSIVSTNNAAAIGIIVVASAGNAGDVYYAVGSPSTAERAISVAASEDGASILGGFKVVAPASMAGVYPGSEAAFGPNLLAIGPVTGTLGYPSNSSQNPGCATFNITNTATITGKIALIDRGTCTFKTKVRNAQLAGATGVLIANNAPGDPSTMGDDAAITNTITIPSQMTDQTTGTLLKTALASNIVTVTLTAQYRNSTANVTPSLIDTIASFTSRGPRRDSLLKPDITAPGVTIFSALNHSGSGGTSYNGTSMAAPHVAGSMALLKQLHPDWTVEELKALAMNTATTDITQGANKYGPGRVGAGRITLPNAASSPVIAYSFNEPYLTSVSFGAPEVAGAWTSTRSIKVVNKSANTLNYYVDYLNYVDVPGVTYTVTPAKITLAPSGSALVYVTIDANAAQMKHTKDATVSSAGGRSWLSEEAGYVVLTPGLRYKLYLPLIAGGAGGGTSGGAGGGTQPTNLPKVRVPIYAAPRPVSDMHALVSSLNFTGVTGTATIPVTGTGINTGVNYPIDIVSLVTGYELAETSPNDLITSGGTDNADLKYVGVTNDFRASGFVTGTTVYFGIATWGNHATPSEVTFNIYIDANRDGAWDYQVYNTTTGSSSSPSDAMVTAVKNLSTGAIALDSYVNITPMLDTGMFNSDVIVLPVSAGSIGLSNANPRFDYQVKTSSIDAKGTLDTSALHTYSAATAGLDFTNNPLGLPGGLDLPGSGVSVSFNLAPYLANGSQGALLLHHHNASGQRTEVLSVTTPSNFATISILHTNDFHGQLEASGSNPGYARDVAVINEARATTHPANILLLDAGDGMQGSLLSNLNKGAPVIDLFNLAGVKAATFGNHEFDWGQPVLISRTQQANYPFVSANIVVSDSTSCATAGWTSPSFAKPWITTTVGAPGNQVVVGIVGVSTQETPYITIASATQGLCFKDPALSASHYYTDLKAAGAQVIVVLSHLGNIDGGYGYGFAVYGDQTLARKLVEAGTPANLIIGGHSHTNLAAAQVVSGTTVAQAYYNGRNIGRADLLVNKTSGAVTINWQRISLGNSTAWAEDAAAKAKVAVWANDPVYKAQINVPIGYTKVDLPRNSKADNMMGAFVDDAIYNYLNNDGDSTNDIDLFFNNAGGIRTDWCRIPDSANPGQYKWSSTVTDCHSGVYTDTPMLLTYGNMFTILPFGNATVVGKMTGAQIMEIVNYAPQSINGVIQPAGLKYMYYAYTDTVKDSPQPWAWGAYSVTVKNRGTGLYEPLVMTQTYSVGTNEFLAPAGQDGYSGFKYMTNVTYWGDMLNAVNAWVTANYTITTPYQGPNNDGTLDGRIIRNGADTYGGTATEVVPVTILAHNDSHGRLLPSGSAPGFTNLATLINRERQHNAARTILLQGGDNIQGDAMDAFYKAAFTGKGSDGTLLPSTLITNPMIAAMNALTYTAMTLGNHEFNFGSYIFTGTLGQAAFPLLQANLYDDGSYGIAEVGVEPFITRTLPGPAGDINLAVLGIGNHRVPQYELPSNIPGLTFTNPITEAQLRAPALKATHDVVVALTHIGFTTNPASVEVDNNVDTNLAAQTTGIDAIIGSHSHTNPAAPEAPYKFLPTYVGSPANVPVIINQAYRYNTYLGEVVLGLLPKAGGGYDVVARAGRYLANSTSVAEDPVVKAIVKPYDDFLAGYKNRAIGRTAVPIDTTNAYLGETNAANQQVDASLWKLTSTLSITIDFHLSGAMTQSNPKVMFPTATATNPVTMTINDMFTLMPYENSLVVLNLNGAQLKAILERGFRNYWYYKNVSGQGGYSYYTTCLLDISAGSVVTYQDTISYTPGIDYVVGMTVKGVPIDFTAATTYTVSTVNYLAAGSCNFNNGGVSLWPLDQIAGDTQNYVRDVVIEYLPTLSQPISPVVEGRLRFLPVP